LGRIFDLGVREGHTILIWRYAEGYNFDLGVRRYEKVENPCYTTLVLDLVCIIFFSITIFSSQWQLLYSPIGESCNVSIGNADVEKCVKPILKPCVDRNKYCDAPPPIPTLATKDDIYVPVPQWNNVPDTKFNYYCLTNNWAFNYKTSPTAPSYYFTKNINNMTITCNKNG
jgi:hypothetical protein